MAKTNNDVDLLKLMRGGNRPQNNSSKPGGFGLLVVKVITVEPEATFVFEGAKIPVDIDIFEVPIRLLPLEEGARYFALPIVGNGTRFGLLEKIDGEGVKGTFISADNKTIVFDNGLIKEVK
ncbi:hypothetical protein [Lysinibacillus sp. 54212]|uniref:hypothetical protein n=1 Tax=Lysinibacillus sp. 54212 TaxID=3119829 RepID=UPI002FC9F486